jgi:hypothetical protein
MNKAFLNFNMAAKLQRIGIPNASGYFYKKSGMRKDKDVYSSKEIFTGMTNFDSVYLPAYLSQDLEDVMPAEIKSKGDLYTLTIRKTKVKYDVRYENSKGQVIYREYADSSVEAEAKIILFLKKHKYI